MSKKHNNWIAVFLAIEYQNNCYRNYVSLGVQRKRRCLREFIFETFGTLTKFSSLLESAPFLISLKLFWFFFPRISSIHSWLIFLLSQCKYCLSHCKWNPWVPFSALFSSPSQAHPFQCWTYTMIPPRHPCIISACLSFLWYFHMNVLMVLRPSCV